MRIAKDDYMGGDYYPIVRAWCRRLGVVEFDKKANAVKLDEKACRIYVEAVMGKKFKLTFRTMHGSLGRAGRVMSLSRWDVKHGHMSLGTVLHECAHSVRYRNFKNGMAKDWRGHGEAFTRTYARLLKDVMS